MELSNVWVRYFGQKRFELKGINLEIEGGEKVAIIGKRGSGRSALVWTLLRIIETEFGEYKFNGDIVKGVDLKILRR